MDQNSQSQSLYQGSQYQFDDSQLCSQSQALEFVIDDLGDLGAAPTQTQEDLGVAAELGIAPPGGAYAGEEPFSAGGVCDGCSTIGDSSSAPLNFVEDYAIEVEATPTELPPWRCEYCNIHTPAAVVKCVATGKWFCNYKPAGLPASCIVYHLVRSRNSEVMLHKESPLGEITLECFITGTKNVFQLGFVPVKEDLVVLLARDTEVNHTEYDGDLSKWAPLIQEKEFVQWLVKKPSDAEALRARNLNVGQIQTLEELWRTNPSATIDDVITTDGDLQDAEVASVQDRYEDAYQYQNIMGPLVKLEADYDKHMKEQQTQENITVRWDKGLNEKRIAFFSFSQNKEDEMRVLTGDELLLKHPGDGTRAAWQGSGTVVRLSASEEIGIELKSGGNAPIDINHGFTIDFVWKSIAYDRMQVALKTFAVDETSVSGYIYHRLLGHEVEAPQVRVTLPRRFGAPGLPELNHSQVFAVKEVLQKALSIVQGPPGTGKTVTSASIVYHLAKQNQGQTLVCAPSNVAVDQLTEKIHKTGLRVVRFCAKSRERVDSSVEYLTLHYQVRHLDTPERASSSAPPSARSSRRPRSCAARAPRRVTRAFRRCAFASAWSTRRRRPRSPSASSRSCSAPSSSSSWATTASSAQSSCARTLPRRALASPFSSASSCSASDLSDCRCSTECTHASPSFRPTPFTRAPSKMASPLPSASSSSTFRGQTPIGPGSSTPQWAKRR